MTNKLTDAHILVSAREAARMLSISERTLFTLTATGEVSVVRIGKRAIRYTIEDLRSFVSRRRQNDVSEQTQNEGHVK